MASNNHNRGHLHKPQQLLQLLFSSMLFLLLGFHALLVGAHSDPNPQLSSSATSSKSFSNFFSPSSTSSSSSPSSLFSNSLHAREEEVNPVAPKFDTVPDAGMPPALDFSVLHAEISLSSWDDERLQLMSERFIPGAYQARVGLANGYIGAAVASAGPFFEKDINQTNHPGPDSEVTEGWPLFDSRQTFSTVSGFWDCQATTPGTNFPELLEYGCENVISGIPHPLAFNLVVGDHVLDATVDPTTITNYSRVVSFQDGLSEWGYTWSPKNTNVSFDIEFVALISRLRPNVAATQLKVTPRERDCNASIIDLLDGRSAKRSYLGMKGMRSDSPYSPSIFVSNHPDGLPHVEAWTVSTANVSNGYTDESSRRISKSTNATDMTVGQQWDVRLVNGKTAVFQKYIGVASTDKFPDAELTATTTSKMAFEAGWGKIISEHTQAWNKLMQQNLMTSYRDPATGRLPVNDSTIEKLQIAAVADRYYILQNLLPEDGSNLNDNGVSVGGLSSDSYGGLLFWDQEIWMYPGLAITNPEYSKQILKFRLKKFAQAKANAQFPYAQAKYKFDNLSALYSWTTGRFSNATGTGPVLDYEYHINTDIVLAMLQDRAITGNEMDFRDNFWPVVESIGHTIATLLVKDGDGWSIRNMTDPDEYANMVDNGAFTLASMSQVMLKIISIQREYGLEVNETWVNMAENVNIPRADSGITKEYQDMQNNVTVKQADVTLMTYPLALTRNYTMKDKIMDLAYYSQKQTPDGPAMTFAIAAIAENLVAQSGCAAFTYEMQARFSNYRAPWYQMSEQANDDRNANGGIPPAFPFLTGHGGALQIAPFGYLGLDLTQDTLTIHPSLPPPYKYLKIQDFHFKGTEIRVSMNSTHTNVTRIPTSGVVGLTDTYSSTPLPVTVGSPNGRKPQQFFALSINETFTVANDMYWQNFTTSHNLLQCRPTFSATNSAPGQGADAATDGNVGTRWQPLSRNASSITVDMQTVPFQRITQINLEWGERLPASARVGLTNSSSITSLDDKDVTIISIPSITQSERYDANASHVQVVPYVGNRTTYLLPANQTVWSGRYAVLEIVGCVGCGGGGGTEYKNVSGNGEGDGKGATVGEFEIIGALRNDVV